MHLVPASSRPIVPRFGIYHWNYQRFTRAASIRKTQFLEFTRLDPLITQILITRRVSGVAPFDSARQITWEPTPNSSQTSNHEHVIKSCYNLDFVEISSIFCTETRFSQPKKTFEKNLIIPLESLAFGPTFKTIAGILPIDSNRVETFDKTGNFRYFTKFSVWAYFSTSESYLRNWILH